MQLPKISLITVCYNAEPVIEATLRSVAEQSYEEIEYIVIDGSSQDTTLELVGAITPFAHVYSEPDKGIYDAMNKGLHRATGDYVWFLNAGDSLPSRDTVATMVAMAVEGAESYPDVIYGDTRIVDAERRDLGARRLRPPKGLTWQSFRDGMLVCHQSFIPKRELCPDYDLEYRLSADVDWCIRVLKVARSTYFVDMPLSCYLEEGTTTRHWKESLLERFWVMSRHYGFIPTVFRHLRFFFVRHR